jgi:hypothetical protein
MLKYYKIRSYMEYSILKCADLDELVKLVNDKIKHGYEPIGGLVIESNPNFRPLYYQTLVYIDPK